MGPVPTPLQLNRKGECLKSGQEAWGKITMLLAKAMMLMVRLTMAIMTRSVFGVHAHTKFLLVHLEHAKAI